MNLFPAILAAMCLAACGIAVAPPPHPLDPMTHAFVIAIDVGEAGTLDATIVAMAPIEVAAALAGPDDGELQYQFSDETGMALAVGQVADPRRVQVERIGDTGAFEAIESIAASGNAMIAVPAPASGRGTLQLTYAPVDRAPETIRIELVRDAATVEWGADVAAAASPLVAGRREALEGPADLVYVGGVEDPHNDLLFVFLPNKYTMREDFLRDARMQATLLRASSVWREYADRISLYALWSEQANRAVTPDACGDSFFVWAYSGVLQAALPQTSPATYATTHRTPTKHIVLTDLPETTCRATSFLLKGPFVVMPGAGSFGLLAHELAHATAGLADEYPEMACGFWSFAVHGPNVETLAPDARPSWECLRPGSAHEARCPDDVPVDIVHPGTCSAAVPCSRCLMGAVEDGEFCPVCAGLLRAHLDAVLGERASEECDGVDNDQNGTTDDGCGCSALPPGTADAMCPTIGLHCGNDLECCAGEVCVVDTCEDCGGKLTVSEVCTPGAGECCGRMLCSGVSAVDDTRCCYRDTEPCEYDTDCCGGMTCSDFHCACIPAGSDRPCLTGVECCAGSFCLDGRCT